MLRGILQRLSRLTESVEPNTSSTMCYDLLNKTSRIKFLIFLNYIQEPAEFSWSTKIQGELKYVLGIDREQSVL